MNPLKELRTFGQSVWLDYIDSKVLDGGGLQRLVEEDGLGGVTSNPTIFEQAIARGSEDLRLARIFAEDPLAGEESVFTAFAVEALQKACEILAPIHQSTQGRDGFASLEVSPRLAHDTDGTIAEALRLWKAVGRTNLMIKVPGTPEGVPAIEDLIARGVNVNVTLLFSPAQYEAAAQAYIRGLSRAAEPWHTASVASLFVSRVDTLVDSKLDSIGTSAALALRGKGAVANAKMVYRRFRELFDEAPSSELAARGSMAQRPLWASTGTKNPAYPDILYVQELVGPGTVNTMPPATMEAYRDHGLPGVTVTEGWAEAEEALRLLRELGIDMDAVGEELQAQGVASFTKSYDALLAAVRLKCRGFRDGSTPRITFALGNYGSAVEDRLLSWQGSNFPSRLWKKDPSLWFTRPAPEITDRLGWLDLPKDMEAAVPDLERFSDEIKSEGFRHVLLLGMGGSSLAPEVVARTFGAAPGFPDLTVLDSTHPSAVLDAASRFDPATTLFVVSSKSGTTLETLSLFRYFWNLSQDHLKEPGRHFVAITDPGTPLQALGEARGFRKIFEASPDLGGRYSALSHFGLVPAALMGLDLRALLERAQRAAASCGPGVAVKADMALTLGAALGELALAGRDKVTFLASPGLAALPIWLEQLIAESTGKEGKGIVPVADEPPAKVADYGKDRLFVHLSLEGDGDPEAEMLLNELEAAGHPVARMALSDRAGLGGAFFLWEIAVAAAGAVLDIHPFNQPDVELAKELAREVMSRGDGALPGDAGPVSALDGPGLTAAISAWRASAKAGDYVAIQAYLDLSEGTAGHLQSLRLALRDRMGLATTVGLGPRFLHSTGQLHKGGPDTGLFLQLVDEPAEEVPVPETDYTFKAMIRAQALGDYQALLQRRRRVLRVNLGADTAAGLEFVLAAIRG